jgi:hypothetical protein
LLAASASAYGNVIGNFFSVCVVFSVVF